jgi:tetratricopeptide (TPR) repeat protein
VAEVPSPPPALPAAPPKPRRRPRLMAALAAVVGLAAVGLVGVLVVYPLAAGAYHWRRAQRAVERLDLKEARHQLERCLQIWPKNGEARFLAARTCRRAGDFEAARRHLAEAERLGWVKEIIDLEYLLLTAQIGALARAEPALRRHLERGHPEEVMILEALARGNLQIQAAREAHRWTRIWLERHPDDWQARFWQGQSLAQGGQYELAVEQFQKALEGNPRHPGTNYLLGDALYRVARFSEAAGHFGAALDAEPDDPASLLGLANCQRSLGRPGEARATANRLLDLQPDRADTWLLLGQVALDEDNPAEALALLSRAEALDPFDRPAIKALATACRLLRREADAKKYEDRAKQIDEGNRELTGLRKKLLDSPKDARLRYQAGVVCLRLGRPQEAERWLVGALDLNPNHLEAQRALAECLRRLREK